GQASIPSQRLKMVGCHVVLIHGGHRTRELRPARTPASNGTRPIASETSPPASRNPFATVSYEDFFHHVSKNIGEPIIATAVTVGQFLVVDAHQVKDRGVQVMDVDLVLNGVPAEFIGGAMHDAAFHTAAREPHGEPERMMLATVRSLGRRGAAEFAAPDH